MSTPTPVRLEISHHMGLAVGALVLLAVATVFSGTYTSIAAIWMQTSAYSHCFLILPISSVLVWLHREALAKAQPAISVAGFPVLLGISLLWFVSHRIGIQVLEQFAAVAILPALFYTLMGGSLFRIVRFPLLYLLMAVPFGDFLIPGLIDFTARFCVDALNVLGIPVLREGRFFRIPTGSYEVAKACAGLQYFIATFALTTLYSYFLFRASPKRIAFVVFSMFLAIVANGVRATVVVLILHLSDFDIAAGEDHEFVGLIIFAIMLIALFFVGRHFQDRHGVPGTDASGSELPDPGSSRSAPRRARGTGLNPWLAPVGSGLLAGLFAVAGPALALTGAIEPAGAVERAAHAAATFPRDLPGWQPGVTNGSEWRPVFLGADSAAMSRYRRGTDEIVDVAVIRYFSGRQGAEVSSALNKIADTDVWVVENIWQRSVTLDDGALLPLREVGLAGDGGPRLVWYWYSVNDRVVGSELQTKIVELSNLLVGRVSISSAVIVSTKVTDSAEESRTRLRQFVSVFHRNIADCLRLATAGSNCTSGAINIKEG